MLVAARLAAVAGVVWLSVAPVAADAVTYTIDPKKSEVLFSYSMTLSTGTGRFSTVTGTSDINDADLAKTTVLRLAFAQGEELAPHGCTAVALTPGWLRSEMMLEHFGVTEANWREGAAVNPHFAAISESPRFVGRAVAALAAAPEHHRRNGGSFSSGGLAREYGFTDVDGSQPDCWRYLVEVQDAGLEVSDRVRVAWESDHPEVVQAVEHHAAVVRDEVLAIDLVRDPQADRTETLNGRPVRFRLEKA